MACIAAVTSADRAAPVGAPDGERRFPTAARTPGTPITNGAPERHVTSERAGIRNRDDVPGSSRSQSGGAASIRRSTLHRDD